MQLQPITAIDQIKKGDTIVLTGDKYHNKVFEVPYVKVSEQDGTEVILHKGKNHFFNLGMYLEGKSWVKKVCKIID